jgi:hypothetical protein
MGRNVIKNRGYRKESMEKINKNRREKRRQDVVRNSDTC